MQEENNQPNETERPAQWELINEKPIENQLMKTQIHWTDSEREAIVSRYIADFPNEIPIDRRVREVAYKVLPEERRRDHISPDDPVKRQICAKQNLTWVSPASTRKTTAKPRRTYTRRPTNSNNSEEAKLLMENAALRAHCDSLKSDIRLEKLLGIILLSTELAVEHQQSKHNGE